MRTSPPATDGYLALPEIITTNARGTRYIFCTLDIRLPKCVPTYIIIILIGRLCIYMCRIEL